MRTAAMLLLLLVGVSGAVFGMAFWRNGLPWHLPPGRTARLMTYVTTHVADTTESSLFPELRPRRYEGVSAEALFAVVERAVGKLGWNVLQRDRSGRVLRAVVTTPLFKFQDDVEIAIADAGGGRAQLRVRSVSRVGQGDLGANTAHILTLYRVMDADFPWSGGAAPATP